MKKIMFSDRFYLTRAVLDGHKTMTRRLAPIFTPLGNWSETEKFARYKVGEVVAIAQRYEDIPNEKKIDEYGKLYVKHALLRDTWYQASEKGLSNKMFVHASLMPHHIRITNIRIEQVQDISEEECKLEGVYKLYGHDKYYAAENTPIRWSAKEAFADQIDGTYGKGTWERNPYMFVYEFELVD